MRTTSLTLCNVCVLLYEDGAAVATYHKGFARLGNVAKGRPGDAPKMWHVVYPDGTEPHRYYATRRDALTHALLMASKSDEKLRAAMRVSVGALATLDDTETPPTKETP